MNDIPRNLLTFWIERQAAAESARWLAERSAEICLLSPDDTGGDRCLDLAFGRVPRLFGRAALELGDADLADAEAARPGWRPDGWTIDGAARVLLLLHLPGAAAGFAARFRRLRQKADAAEQVALFHGLPLYPAPDALAAEAGDGLRSNMRPVFEAVAHHSPYPREIFDRHRWNHMVLKALFVDSSLAPIQGLDARANPELALMLRDYARERRAAGRSVSPELWRCLAPFADAVDATADLALALASADAEECAAAAAALFRGKTP